MKKVFIYIIISLSIFLFFSCHQNEEVYSCDPTIDSWVKENITEIRRMTRDEWINVDKKLNRAVYSAFSQEQKYDFWNEKIADVLELEWNENEIEHLQFLQKTVINNPLWFSDDYLKDELNYEAFQIFIYKWGEYAFDNLGWDEKLVGSIIATGEKMLNTKGDLFVVENSPVRLKTSKEVDCNCHRGNVLFTMCGGINYCEAAICKTDRDGCGAFWRESCDGVCAPR